MTEREKIVLKYGDPFVNQSEFERRHMTLFLCQTLFPSLPFRRIYCNKDIVEPLKRVFTRLQSIGKLSEIKTFDGCFLVRYIRGYETQKIPSLHSYGIAVDFNAAENGLGKPVKFSPEFLQAWRDEGWVCGADFKRLDGMHFQYTKHLTESVA